MPFSYYLWIDDDPKPGHLNMAVDHALLDLAAAEGAVVLRVYRWDPHCLSFGRHEPALRRYGRDRVEAMGLDCVRRPTGGRAVWHARELTYAVAAPSGFGGLTAAYHRIHELLAEALRSLGVDSVAAPRPAAMPGPGAGACFATAVGGEILVRGRKVVGSAQLRTAGGLLQHGSLLLEDDQALVRNLVAPAGKRAADPGRNATPPASPEAALSEILGRRVAFAEAAGAIARAARLWSAAWRPAPGDRVLERAGALAPHYRDPAWTWRR